MEAVREGRDLPPPASDLARSIRGLFLSTPASADLFRDFLEYIGTITPVQTILERPDVVERLAAAREAMKGISPPPPPPGPSRSQLLQIVA
jgi:hypothetical protein